MNASATDWIKPGADIVVYRDDDGRRDSPTYHVTKVKRVAGQSFTVEAIDERFKLVDLATRRGGATWQSWRWRAVERDSDKHHELRMARIKAQARTAAITAVEKWRTDRDDLARVDAVIEAMQAVRVVLEPTWPTT